MIPKVAGLLPGVDLVRVGECGPEEFVQAGDYILLGPAAKDCSRIVVKPTEGWEFKYDIRCNAYLPVRVMPGKKVA